MKERAYEAGIRPVDVLLTSAKKSHEMTELLENRRIPRWTGCLYRRSNKCRKIDAYQSNHQNTAGVQDVITTSQFPGTTLDKIEIPLDDGHFD